MRLWKNNRLDQEWELAEEEIAERFAGSSFDDEGRQVDVCLRNFITAPEAAGGLASVFEETEWSAVYAAALRKLKLDVS